MSSQCFLLVCLTPLRTKKVVTGNKKSVWSERRKREMSSGWVSGRNWMKAGRAGWAGQGQTKSGMCPSTTSTTTHRSVLSQRSPAVARVAAYILRQNSQVWARSELSCFTTISWAVAPLLPGWRGQRRVIASLVLGKVGGSEGAELVGQHSHPGRGPSQTACWLLESCYGLWRRGMTDGRSELCSYRAIFTGILRSLGSASRSIVFVMDEFPLYASEPLQSVVGLVSV